MVELFRDHMEEWGEEIRDLRRAELQAGEDQEVSRSNGASVPEVDFHIVEVNFKSLLDDGERRYFNSLPTNFKPAPGAVDRLREAAGKILRQSEDWKTLLRELSGSEANGSPGCPVRSGEPK
jgi:NTE family protein